MSAMSRDGDTTVVGGPLLHVDGLTVSLPGATGRLLPVDSVSFEMAAGEVVGIVGESGSGKTLTALAIAQLVPFPAQVSAKALLFGGYDLLTAPPKLKRTILASRLSMIFQNPMASLNPAMRIGPQLIDGLRSSKEFRRREARARARHLLGEVNIARPEAAMRRYPFEFSGGMRQRAMIAMALMAEPELLIADEPTTALDVTVQAQVLEVLRQVNREHGTAIILISHNLGIISEICQRVLVMYAGRIVEDLDVTALATGAAHPYTKALMASVPSLEGDRSAPLVTIPGRPPRLEERLPGCAFAPRCGVAIAQCSTERPELAEMSLDHRVACFVAIKHESEVMSRGEA